MMRDALLGGLAWLAVLLLTAEAFWTATHSNFNFGVLITVVLAAAAWVLRLFYKPLGRFLLGSLPGRVVLGLLCAGAALAAGILLFLCFSVVSTLPTGQEQVVIVLGAGLRGDTPSLLLRYRLDAAFEYWQKHPEILIATTGGQGRGETVPEGLAMKRYLAAKGVPEDRILSEEASTSTEENFLFVKELLAARGIPAEAPVVVVTNDFHCYRGRQYARKAGFTQVASLAAHTPFTAVLPCYLREVFAVLYYWVFKSSRTGWMAPFVGLMQTGPKPPRR